MINQQLFDYIRQQLQQGENREGIKNSLIAQGWQEQDINTAFQAIESRSSTVSKNKKWKKIILIIFGIIVFLITTIILLPSFLGLFAKDIPLINDSDILLKKVDVPDDQNAYFDLVKLDNIIFIPEGKSKLIDNMAAGKEWDAAIAEKIVSRNERAFRYFAEAAQKPKFQDPTYSDPENISFYNMSLPRTIWQTMANLSAIRSIHLANQGKGKEAMEEALNSIKIGQKIQESQNSLVQYIRAMKMKDVGLETIQRIIPLSKLSNLELVTYARGLDVFYKNEKGLIDSFKGEYHLLAWIVNYLAGGGKEALQGIVGKDVFGIADRIENNYYFQPNKTKLIFAEYIRAKIKNANLPCGEIKATEISRLASANSIKTNIEENIVGKILHDVFATDLTNVIINRCKEDLLVAATQTIIAIKAYKNDNGDYPASLDDLTPRYLFSVPIDPFDGKALKYSSANKIVYSVGHDLQGFNNNADDDWRNMSDPTFKIGF